MIAFHPLASRPLAQNKIFYLLIVDAGVKALGLPAAGAAAHLDGKLNAAAKAAMAEDEAETKTSTKKEN